MMQIELGHNRVSSIDKMKHGQYNNSYPSNRIHASQAHVRSKADNAHRREDYVVGSNVIGK